MIEPSESSDVHLGWSTFPGKVTNRRWRQQAEQETEQESLDLEWFGKHWVHSRWFEIEKVKILRAFEASLDSGQMTKLEGKWPSPMTLGGRLNMIACGWTDDGWESRLVLSIEEDKRAHHASSSQQRSRAPKMREGITLHNCQSQNRYQQIVTTDWMGRRIPRDFGCAA